MLAISIQLSHPGFQEFELVCTGPVVHILKIEKQLWLLDIVC